jgi:hypothetical protein
MAGKFPTWVGIPLATKSIPALRPTSPLSSLVPETFSPRVKRQGLEADYSPPSSVEIENTWRYTSTPTYFFVTWFLIKHKTWLRGVALG